MIDIKRLKEEQKDQHPGFSSYIECMTRTLFTGLAGFTLSFSGVYLLQNLLQKQLPYNKKFFVLTSAICGSFIAFKITKDRTKSCQAKWMAFEDKHTILKEEE